MDLIDFILNLAGLLLWFNWRTARYDPLAGSAPATLAGTLRRAGSPAFKNWRPLLALFALLLLRAVLYWQIGAAVGWTGNINLPVVSIPFHSDLLKFKRMLLFSIYSFGVALTVFHLWLLLLSILKSASPEIDSLRHLLRLHLGRCEGWARGVKLLLPVVVIVPVWWLATWPLTYLDVLPSPPSTFQRWQQSLLVGVGSYLCWKYLIVGMLALYVVNSYVFFGRHPFWQHLNESGRQLLAPLRFIRWQIGRVDFAPVVGMVLVLALAHFAEQGAKSPRRYDKTGVELPRRVNLPGLVELYQRASS